MRSRRFGVKKNLSPALGLDCRVRRAYHGDSESNYLGVFRDNFHSVWNLRSSRAVGFTK